MKSDLSIEKIYQQCVIGQLDKNSAFELLISIIENDNETEIRVRSINFIEKLELKNERVYKTLENLLISDSESTVRSAAAWIIIRDFIDEGLEALEWALEHDNSPRCVNNIIYHLKTMKKISENEIKAILINILKIIRESQLIFDDCKYSEEIKPLFNDDIITQWSLNKIIELFLNFKTLNFFNENFSGYYTAFIFEGLAITLTLDNLDVKSLREFEGIEYLTKLESLSIWNTKISEICCLEKMEELNSLYIGESSITKITGLNNLEKLEKLDLSNNQITEISGLENLTNLEKLNLSGNQIKEINGLNNLNNLWELRLGEAGYENLTIPQNLISEIKGLDSLTNLYELYLSHNLITEIKGLEKLVNLNMLVLINNKITEIKGLDSNENLGLLNLSGNPIPEKEREKYKLYPYTDVRFDDLPK